LKPKFKRFAIRFTALLFGEKSQIPKLAASHLICRAIQLNAFDYTFVHVSGPESCIADALSCLPVCSSTTTFETDASRQIKKIDCSTIKNLTLTKHILRNKVSANSTLPIVIQYLNSCWPLKKHLNNDLFPFYEKRDQLMFKEGILLWGLRIVIQTSICQFVLTELHETHPSINATKSLERLTVWWPHCNQEIESFVKK